MRLWLSGYRFTVTVGTPPNAVSVVGFDQVGPSSSASDRELRLRLRLRLRSTIMWWRRLSRASWAALRNQVAFRQLELRCFPCDLTPNLRAVSLPGDVNCPCTAAINCPTTGLSGGRAFALLGFLPTFVCFCLVLRATREADDRGPAFRGRSHRVHDRLQLLHWRDQGHGLRRHQVHLPAACGMADHHTRGILTMIRACFACVGRGAESAGRRRPWPGLLRFALL